MGINMKFKTYTGRLLLGLGFFVLFFLTANGSAHAALQGGKLSLSPNSGTYAVGQTFTITATIDGGGYPFNAAKASVLVSPALSVQDITLGNCGFAFVRTPVQQDPSFVGVILGGSSKSCTLYTLTVKAVAQGDGTITFVNSSVKAYKSAVDILTSLQNATFTISGSQQAITTTPPPIQPPTTSANGTKLYDIVFRISQPHTVPFDGIYIVLDPNLPSQKTAIPEIIPNIFSPDTTSGSVTFSDVPQGAHTLATYYSNQLLSKQIIYVSGNSKTLVLGVNENKPLIPWQLIASIAAALIILILIAMLIYKVIHLFTNRQVQPPSEPETKAQPAPEPTPQQQ